MVEVTYYLDGYNASFPWDNDPEKMVDNILTNYATTKSDGDIQVLNSNTCPGTNLGTITKVEVRYYGYGDGDDKLNITCKADAHQTIPNASPATWSSYIDITNDSVAPDPWTWADIQACGMNLTYIKVGKANLMYIAKAEIRVTYTPVGPAKVTQYLAGLDLPVFPHEMDLQSDKLPCPPPY